MVQANCRTRQQVLALRPVGGRDLLEEAGSEAVIEV
jgi:hypothetical protein